MTSKMRFVPGCVWVVEFIQYPSVSSLSWSVFVSPAGIVYAKEEKVYTLKEGDTVIHWQDYHRYRWTNGVLIKEDRINSDNVFAEFRSFDNPLKCLPNLTWVKTPYGFKRVNINISQCTCLNKEGIFEYECTPDSKSLTYSKDFSFCPYCGRELNYEESGPFSKRIDVNPSIEFSKLSESVKTLVVAAVNMTCREGVCNLHSDRYVIQSSIDVSVLDIETKVKSNIVSINQSALNSKE